MTGPILQTRLHIPRTPGNHVARQRLFDLLDEGPRSGHRLILISAPAGFGKTVLASSWIRARNLPAAWLTIEPDLDDPGVFLSYLVHAVSRRATAFGEGILQAVKMPGPPPIETLLAALINDLDALPGPLEPGKKRHRPGVAEHLGQEEPANASARRRRS